MFAARRLATVSSHLASVSAPRITAAAAPRIFAAPYAAAKLGSSFSTAASPEAMSNAKTLVDAAIKDNDVLVFSKSYCPVSRWRAARGHPRRAAPPRGKQVSC